MTQVHFTLKSEEIQSIIEYSVKDDVSKNILTTVFNQLMENQRTEYIQADDYERSESRQSQRNGYYEWNGNSFFDKFYKVQNFFPYAIPIVLDNEPPRM